MLVRVGGTTEDDEVRRTIPWSQIARSDVDDVAVPLLRGRGSCLVLTLTDRKRVRLWATERSGGDRFEVLTRQAERLRQVRRDLDR